MSKPSKTTGIFGRFNPRRLFSGLGAFARDLRTSHDLSENSCESSLNDIVWDDDFVFDNDMRPSKDGDGPSCDLCFNEHRQQDAHSFESTDSTSSDYRTAPLPPDEADVEIPLETRDSIECLLETLQMQHGGKVRQLNSV